jgi:hypothetical protein
MSNQSKQSITVDLSKYESTSAKIRACAAAEMSRSDIERYLRANGVTTKNGDPIRYQHIRNVLITPLTNK